MPTFVAPTVDDVPPVLKRVPGFPQGDPQTRLFAHYKSRARGRTLLWLVGDTFVLVDWPAQLVPVDPSEGDPFTESGIAGYEYVDIYRVFMGGHIYEITSAEATILTAAGYGSGITP